MIKRPEQSLCVCGQLPQFCNAGGDSSAQNAGAGGVSAAEAAELTATSVPAAALETKGSRLSGEVFVAEA